MKIPSSRNGGKRDLGFPYYILGNLFNTQIRLLHHFVLFELVGFIA